MRQRSEPVHDAIFTKDINRAGQLAWTFKLVHDQVPKVQGEDPVKPKLHTTRAMWRFAQFARRTAALS